MTGQPENGMSIRPLHDGMKAEDSRKSKAKKDKQKAYGEGLEKLQTDYWAGVSREHGMQKTTEKRERLKRKELVKQRNEQAKKDRILNIERENSALKNANNELEATNESLNERVSSLQLTVRKLENYILQLKEK